MTGDSPRFIHRATANMNPVLSPDARISSRLVYTPLGVNEGLLDPGSLNGLLLGMSFRDDDGHHTLGSAVMVGPGLALCAQHVLRDQGYFERIQIGKAAVVCWGAHDGDSLSLWTVRHVTTIPDSDLAILSMSLSSDLPSGTTGTAHITTRMPAVGEELVLCGFTAQEPTQQRTPKIRIAGEVRFTRGRVTQVFPEGRDRVMLPGPCLEVDCHAFGGMSGGPVFDDRGYLVGIVTSSFEGIVTAYVSHVWPALVRGMTERVWPKRETPIAGTLLYLGRKSGIMIERPDAFRLIVADGELGTEYVAWT